MKILSLFLLIFLIACTQNSIEPAAVVDVSDETADELEVLSNESAVIESEIESDYIPVLMNFTETFDNVSETADDFVEEIIVEDLSISEQDKMTKLLNKLVVDSSCYNLSWTGFDENKDKFSLSVRKDVNFVYVSGLEFKGWIVFNLYSAKNRLATETVPVAISNLSFSCSETDFVFDWTKLNSR